LKIPGPAERAKEKVLKQKLSSSRSTVHGGPGKEEAKDGHVTITSKEHVEKKKPG